MVSAQLIILTHYKPQSSEGSHPAGGTKKIKQREEDRKEVMGRAGVHEAPQTIDILVCPFRSLCNSRLSLITCQFVTIVN